LARQALDIANTTEEAVNIEAIAGIFTQKFAGKHWS
jgi:hypothetical protein